MASKADKQWWNNLDKDWKEELVRNLLDSPKYKKRNLVLTDIYEQLDESAEIITDIVNIEKLQLSWWVGFDDSKRTANIYNLYYETHQRIKRNKSKIR